MADQIRQLGPNELEDVVLIDALIIIVTAPIWVTWLVWRLVVGLWADWRKRG